MRRTCIYSNPNSNVSHQKQDHSGVLFDKLKVQCAKRIQCFLWDCEWSLPVTVSCLRPSDPVVRDNSKYADVCHLFTRMTSDSVDFHRAARFRLLSARRGPFRHLGGAAVGSTLVTLSSIKRSWLSIIREAHYQNGTSDVYAFTRLRGGRRYWKWSSCLKGWSLFGQRLTGYSVVKGHYSN